MTYSVFGGRFLETTRGRVVTLLRRGARTVEELAQSLGVTDNAVRNHLAVLERDGLVRQTGVRRAGGVGKPAVLYELQPDAEPLFSVAYPPVLTAVLESLVQELPRRKRDALLEQAGRNLAASLGGEARGSVEERARAAAAALTSLGGEVDVVRENGQLLLRGWGCPLSAAVRQRPELCRAVESLVSSIIGTEARECCEHGARPRCCFAVQPAA